MGREEIKILEEARRIAGGVSFLADRLGIDAYLLDEMLHGLADIPQWVRERAAAFLKEAEN